MSAVTNLARQFIRLNIQAIAAERIKNPPALMNKKALFLRAASLFAEDPNVENPVERTEQELHTLCLIYVSENAK